MLAPPYCSGTVMPSTPNSPILRHRSIGNWSLRSISAARGAISAAAKACTASRRASMSSPSWKSSPGSWLMGSPWWGSRAEGLRGGDSVAHVGAAGDAHQRGTQGDHTLRPAIGAILPRQAVGGRGSKTRLGRSVIGNQLDVYVNVNDNQTTAGSAGAAGDAPQGIAASGLGAPLLGRGQQLAAARLVQRQLVERDPDVVELLLELLAVCRQRAEKGVELRRGVALGVVHRHQLLDLLQRETQPLAAQRELEPGAVAPAVDAVAAHTRR